MSVVHRYLAPALLALSVFLAPLRTWAFEPFVVKDIRLEGLQRIEVGTVFTYLPIKVGDRLDEKLSAQAIRALYKTGFFKDIRLEREGDVLVISVRERPAIASVSFSGNDEISSDQLGDALKQIGLAEGRILDRSLLDKVQRELQRQYYSLGKYAVRIDTEVKPLVRNRVAVEIRIAEGETAEIRQVAIVGNRKFDDKELLKRLELAQVGWLGGRENYSRQVLSADLERLRSYYLDRGFINFSIDSTQVALTPDKEDVYVTINITEGEQYTVSGIKLAGDLVFPREELDKLIRIRRGEIFSRSRVEQTRKAISDRLAEIGYAFANVNVIPDVDDAARTVDLTVFVDPGRRVYVRRINVKGNHKTRDEVIRRELRQLEGAWMSTKLIADSRTRLDRLGFFEDVAVETPAVPGTNDLVDVDFTVSERPTGSLSAGVGFSDTQGFLVNFSLTQENFAGTGNRVAVEINNSEVSEIYSFSYRNPYYTEEGISRGFRIYYRTVDAAEANISNYATNSYGASINYGIPLSEIQRAGFGLGFENTELVTSTTTATEILDFIAREGRQFDTLTLDFSWTRDSRNRAIFADRGSRTTASLEIAAPGGDLQYYRANVSHVQYIPITEDIPLMVRLDLGYGDGYGDTTQLPPFKNYFAGGSQSVRGFEPLSLGGPNTRDSNGDPLGGVARIVSNVELIFPNPFAENSKSVRFSVFVDGGWVYAAEDPIDLGELRYSAGVAAIWLTPIGALRFSLATPLNDQPGDRPQSFQFTMGTPF